MSKLFPLGSFALLAIFCCGLWLACSPFALQTQPAGQPWLPATLNAVIAGALLATTAALGMLAQVMLGLRDLVRTAEVKHLAERDAQAHAATRSAYTPAMIGNLPPPNSPSGMQDPGTASAWREDNPYTHAPARPASPGRAG